MCQARQWPKSIGVERHGKVVLLNHYGDFQIALAELSLAVAYTASRTTKTRCMISHWFPSGILESVLRRFSAQVGDGWM